MNMYGVDLSEYRINSILKSIIQAVDINKTPLQHLPFIIYALQNQLPMPSTSSITRTIQRNNKKISQKNDKQNITARRRVNRARVPKAIKVSKYVQNIKYGRINQKEVLNLKVKSYAKSRGRRDRRGRAPIIYSGAQVLPLVPVIGQIPQIGIPLVGLNAPNILPGQIPLMGQIPKIGIPLQGPFPNQIPISQIPITTIPSSINPLKKPIKNTIIVPKFIIKAQLQKLYSDRKTKQYQKSNSKAQSKAFKIKSFQNIVLKAQRNSIKTKLQEMIKQKVKKQENKKSMLQVIQNPLQNDKFNTKDIKKAIQDYNQRVPQYFQKKKRNQKRRRLQKHELIKKNKKALYQIYGNAIFSKCWPVSRQQIKMALGLLQKDNMSQNVELAKDLYQSSSQTMQQ